MTNVHLRTALFGAMLSIGLFSCDKDDDNVNNVTTGPDIDFYVLTGDNKLNMLNASKPSMVETTVTISGLQPGENLTAIDFRPSTGQLYGLGSSRIYVINTTTGAARAIGAAAFTPTLSGTVTGFDFNPLVDRIRVVTAEGQNLRINPETGAVQMTDGAINGGGSPRIGSVAYTNSMAGASATTLFDIDVTADKLFKQDPPNNGTLVEVGPLGIDAADMGGFDISSDNAVALAAFTSGGASKLYTINTTTGAATAIGDLSGTVMGIAIPTPPVAYAVSLTNSLLIFNPMSTGTVVSKAIMGLQPGENVVGLDFRPVNGQLYAAGSTGRLYTINASSGAATQMGTLPFALLNGTSFGFDFNPLVDRIRVVSNTGQNLRVNPNDGLLAATDGALNPGTPVVTAVAYSNNFAGTTSTVLFDIDDQSDKLYRQDPPNNGTLVEIGALGVNVETNNGFDIGSTSGDAYAALTVGGAVKLYRINLQTGAATAVADLPEQVRGFTLGLGF